MPERLDLLVRGGTVVSSLGRRRADLAIRDGRIVAITASGELDLPAAEVLDADGRFVLPGVIDGHVHFREPGLTHKEDFGTGSLAAVMGGVTTVLEMPNTRPPTDDPKRVHEKVELARAKAWCDFGLLGLAWRESVPKLRQMADSGLVVGFKVFMGSSVGSAEPPDDATLLAAMEEIAATGLRLAAHAENEAILAAATARLRAAGRRDPLAHLESRPVLAEVEAIERLGLLAEASRCRVHVLHLSSRQGLAAVEAWQARGVDLTCETAPHYCFLGAEDMAELGSRMRINPPVRLRSEGHAEALLTALVDGRITAIATDHSPHTDEEKLRTDIWDAVPGFPGVETAVPLFLTYAVNAGRMSLEAYVRASSEGPARAWGLYPRKGAIAVGSDADLVVVDLERKGVITAAGLHGRSRLTPWEGRPTRGAPVATVVRGLVQMLDGEPVGQPGWGRPVSAGG